MRNVSRIKIVDSAPPECGVFSLDRENAIRILHSVWGEERIKFKTIPYLQAMFDMAYRFGYFKYQVKVVSEKVGA